MAMKGNGEGEERDPVRRVGSPCSSPLVDSYFTFVSEEQRQVAVQVSQAAPMSERTLIDLLISDMRSRVQVASSLAERTSFDTGYKHCIRWLSLPCVGGAILRW